MDKVRSAYLEILRIVAAFYVFIYHVGSEEIGGKRILASDHFNEILGLNYYAAHFFVMIFFVLSGFLITSSVVKPNLTFNEFLVARLGRLYSVLLPAILFCYFISFVLIKFFDSKIGVIPNFDNLLPRFFLNIFFGSQIWNLCSTPPLGGPFWSLGYEFFYYLFIACFFLIKKPFSLLVLLVLFLISGLKILILFPVWLMGSILFFLSKKVFFQTWTSFLVFIITVVVVVYTLMFPSWFPFLKNLDDNKLFGFTLFFSWNYMSDYLFGLIVCLNIYSFFCMSKFLLKISDEYKLLFIYRILKYIGNCTYTLYLFHIPLLVFFATILPYNKESLIHNFLLILWVVIVVFIISFFTERRVNQWRNFVSFLFFFLEKNNKVYK